MHIELPAPTATSPSGFTAYWEGKGWWIKVLPEPVTCKPYISVSAPNSGEFSTHPDTAREYATALLAACAHQEAHS